MSPPKIPPRSDTPAACSPTSIHITSTSSVSDNECSSTTEPGDLTVGRKREEITLPDPSAPVKRKRGRPRKNPLPDQNRSQSTSPDAPPKRGPGRPRKDGNINRKRAAPKEATAPQTRRVSPRLPGTHDPQPNHEEDGTAPDKQFSEVKTSAPTSSPIDSFAEEPDCNVGSHVERQIKRTSGAREQAAELSDGEQDLDDSTDVEETPESDWEKERKVACMMYDEPLQEHRARYEEFLAPEYDLPDGSEHEGGLTASSLVPLLAAASKEVSTDLFQGVNDVPQLLKASAEPFDVVKAW
ncbi:hypothetical protein CC86DRAFT_411563 [Ophiobolus disseminans]|uniref:Uncharacterized protein n=1 Tax=Ophiobolus disseminans TaxID=1469910 RepID=A0A6A6ZJY1_9PLEO|nr:hypothetical protein CC86DRAFT_411563 [Ophiobolus disseminans]